MNKAGDFQYGLGIITSHPAEDGAHEWTDSFEDPLLGLLQEQDTKLMSTEWMDSDSLGLLDHHEDTLVSGSHDMPLTPPTTVGSLPNNLGDSWVPDCDQGPHMCRAESYTGDTLPPSPEADVRSSEPAVQRLLDLQSMLFARHMAKPQEIDGLSTLINTTVHSTETLIDVVESLPSLHLSVEGRRSVSPPISWGPAPDAPTLTANTTAYTATELQDQYQRQKAPNFALTISLFMTSYLLLLDSYDELLDALRARLQCSRQSQGPSPGSDFSLSQHFFNNTSGGHFNKLSLVSSFDLDVNSVVFLLSRMMKRLHKSTENRFATGSFAPSSAAHFKDHKFSLSKSSLNFDFQDGVRQDADGTSELFLTGGHSPMAMMGDYASQEVSQRHQTVMESLRVIRWLADEL
ncbi:C6 transcription factor [Colletotrichum tofieldiae]|nr:C6 transcription factor [Colletotrichum tofieldiae]